MAWLKITKTQTSFKPTVHWMKYDNVCISVIHIKLLRYLLSYFLIIQISMCQTCSLILHIVKLWCFAMPLVVVEKGRCLSWFSAVVLVIRFQNWKGDAAGV